MSWLFIERLNVWNIPVEILKICHVEGRLFPYTPEAENDLSLGWLNKTRQKKMGMMTRSSPQWQWRPGVLCLCSICFHSFRALTKAVRLFIASLRIVVIDKVWLWWILPTTLWIFIHTAVFNGSNLAHNRAYVIKILYCQIGIWPEYRNTEPISWEIFIS